MDEAELSKRIENTWNKLQTRMDSFVLYADLVKNDFSGFKSEVDKKEDKNKNVQFKESMEQLVQGYPYAVKLELLCDIYLNQYKFKDNTESFIAAKETASNYINKVESNLKGLIELVDTKLNDKS